MANQKLYWTGPGVVGIGNKEYGADDALPVKDIDSDVLARWKAAGNIGTKISVVVVDKRDTTISKLEEDVAGLDATVSERDATIAKLEEDVAEIQAELVKLSNRKKKHIAKHAKKVKK